jgi:CHASE2 domain-containing sensor protein
MQLWSAAAACLVSIALSVLFAVTYRRDKKKRYLALTAATAALALLALVYSALTLILVGGIE